MKLHFGRLAALLFSLAAAGALFAQSPPPNPEPPLQLLGPQLIAWSELQKPQPLNETSAASDSDSSYEGVITDAHCGAKHAPAIGESAADCTRRCAHAGDDFVLVDLDSAYVLKGDVYAFKKLAGARVRVTGKLDGKILTASTITEY